MSKQVVSSCLILAIGLLGCTLNRNTGGKNREIPQYRVENSMNTETAWMDITKYSTEAAKLPKYRKSQCPPLFNVFSLFSDEGAGSVHNENMCWWGGVLGGSYFSHLGGLDERAYVLRSSIWLSLYILLL